MDMNELAKALRALADRLTDQDGTQSSEQRDAREAVRVLARLVEGKSLYRACGAPGDWGYGTPIGDALSRLYKQEGFTTDTPTLR